LTELGEILDQAQHAQAYPEYPCRREQGSQAALVEDEHVVDRHHDDPGEQDHHGADHRRLMTGRLGDAAAGFDP
jgi:hypothetical protein